EMLRLGTISYIENHSDWICAGNSGDHEAALLELEKFSKLGKLPSLVISDLNFYGEDTGFSLVRKIHDLYPEVKIVVFSMFFAPGVVQNAMQSGASGYVSKNAFSSELLLCMDKVMAGETFIQSELEQSLQQFTAFTDALTRREKDVLNLLLRRMSNDQISDELGIKRRAVENYISSIYEKIGINDRAELLLRYGNMI
ncbi:MAG: response regulator transcription factor, partial [Treponema sp.]|nr:response regulator transcription factor [Treponema sp.]